MAEQASSARQQGNYRQEQEAPSIGDHQSPKSAIDAKQAAEIGLVNFAVPAAELDKTVADWVARLSKGAPRVVRWTKATINTGLKQLAVSMMDTGLAYEGLSGQTEDHAEALKAMREKRKPNFTGR